MIEQGKLYIPKSGINRTGFLIDELFFPCFHVAIKGPENKKEEISWHNGNPAYNAQWIIYNGGAGLSYFSCYLELSVIYSASVSYINYDETESRLQKFALLYNDVITIYITDVKQL